MMLCHVMFCIAVFCHVTPCLAERSGVLRGEGTSGRYAGRSFDSQFVSATELAVMHCLPLRCGVLRSGALRCNPLSCLVLPCIVLPCEAKGRVSFGCPPNLQPVAMRCASVRLSAECCVAVLCRVMCSEAKERADGSARPLVHPEFRYDRTEKQADRLKALWCGAVLSLVVQRSVRPCYCGVVHCSALLSEGASGHGWTPNSQTQPSHDLTAVRCPVVRCLAFRDRCNALRPTALLCDAIRSEGLAVFTGRESPSPTPDARSRSARSSLQCGVLPLCCYPIPCSALRCHAMLCFAMRREWLQPRPLHID